MQSFLNPPQNNSRRWQSWVKIFVFISLVGLPNFTQAEVPKDMILIPAGEFEMGWEGASNKTPHIVFLEGYYIDRFEVTQKDFETVMRENPSKFSGGKRPVDQVTWHEAHTYCQKIGKRLPTEAEWEKAARGGTQSLYYWGGEAKETQTWNKENSEDATHPVGEMPANPYGLHDVYGNVWEWASDWYDRNYYENSPDRNPQGPENGEDKVLRGGSWYSSMRHQTSVTRYWSQPDVRNSNFGFRCARSLAAK